MTTELEKKSVLIVEDDADLLVIFTTVLSRHGGIVTGVTNGLEAIEALAGRKFDLVMTDLRMPRVGGLELASYIRSQDVASATPPTPIIVISGECDASALAKLKRLGVIDVLLKPCEVEEIVRVASDKVRTRSMRTRAFRPDFLRALTMSALDTLGFYLDGIEAGAPMTLDRPEPAGAAAALLPIFGCHVFGSIALRMEASFLAALGTQLFGADAAGMPPAMLRETVLEMINQVGGELKRRLEPLGLPIIIGLPEIVLPGAQLKHKVAGKAVSVPMSRGAALCALEACFGDSSFGKPHPADDHCDIFVSDAA